MIESRTKSVLQGLSLVTVLIFGGFALYHFIDAFKLRADRQEWYQINGAWYAAKCEGEMPVEPITRTICQEAWGRKAYHDNAVAQSMSTATGSAGLALLAPALLLLWSLVLRLKPKR